MKPSISIVIPVFNAESYIEDCINSINQQSYQNYEIVFIDDKSTDRSVELIKKYAINDNRIKLVQQTVNSGPMKCRSLGCKEAQGDYIVFCDADDEMPYDALEKLYSKAQETQADIITGLTELVYPDGTTKKWYESAEEQGNRQDLLLSLLYGKIRHNICAKLFKSSLLKRSNFEIIEGLKYFEDYYLMMQVANISNTYSRINSIVYVYKQNPMSSTHLAYNETRVESDFVAHRRVYDMLKEESGLQQALVSNCQRSIARVYANGFDATDLLRKYRFNDLFTISEIFKNNSFQQAVKILLQSKLFFYLNRN